MTKKLRLTDKIRKFFGTNPTGSLSDTAGLDGLEQTDSTTSQRRASGLADPSFPNQASFVLGAGGIPCASGGSGGSSSGAARLTQPYPLAPSAHILSAHAATYSQEARSASAAAAALTRKADLASTAARNSVGSGNVDTSGQDSPRSEFQLAAALAALQQGSPEQRAAAAEALFNYTAESDVGRQRATAAGAVGCLVDLLKLEGNDNGKMYAAYTLSSLTSVEEALTQMRTLGATPALIAVLNNCPLLVCKKGAMRALGRLARNDEAAAEIVAAGGLKPIVALLQRPDSSLVRRCLIALYFIGADKEQLQQDIGRAGAIPHLLALCRNADSPDVQAEAVDVIKVLSRCEACARLIVDLSGTETLAALAVDGATSRTKASAARALQRLHELPATKEAVAKVAEHGVGAEGPESLKTRQLLLQTIHASVDEGSEDAAALAAALARGSIVGRERALAALEALLAEDQSAARELAELGVVESLLDLVQKGSEAGRKAAGRVLNRIADEPLVLAKLCTTDTTQMLLHAANSMQGSGQRSLVAVLEQIATSGDGADLFAPAEAIPEILKLLDVRSESVQSRAAALLLLLCSSGQDAVSVFMGMQGSLPTVLHRLQQGPEIVLLPLLLVIQVLVKKEAHQQDLLKGGVVPVLLTLFKHEDEPVAEAASKVLEHLSLRAGGSLGRTLSGAAFLKALEPDAGSDASPAATAGAAGPPGKPARAQHAGPAQASAADAHKGAELTGADVQGLTAQGSLTSPAKQPAASAFSNDARQGNRGAGLQSHELSDEQADRHSANEARARAASDTDMLVVAAAAGAQSVADRSRSINGMPAHLSKSRTPSPSPRQQPDPPAAVAPRKPAASIARKSEPGAANSRPQSPAPPAAGGALVLPKGVPLAGSSSGKDLSRKASAIPAAPGSPVAGTATPEQQQQLQGDAQQQRPKSSGKPAGDAPDARLPAFPARRPATPSGNGSSGNTSSSGGSSNANNGSSASASSNGGSPADAAAASCRRPLQKLPSGGRLANMSPGGPSSHQLLEGEQIGTAMAREAPASVVAGSTLAGAAVAGNGAAGAAAAKGPLKERQESHQAASSSHQAPAGRPAASRIGYGNATPAAPAKAAAAAAPGAAGAAGAAAAAAAAARPSSSSIKPRGPSDAPGQGPFGQPRLPAADLDRPAAALNGQGPANGNDADELLSSTYDNLHGLLMKKGDIEFMRTPEGKKCRLGEGGFGVVYKAVMNGVDEVAIKLVKADSPSRKDMELFLKEVQTLAKLHHRNIVQFYGACLETGSMFFVTELMKGGDLYSALRHHPETMRWERLGRKVALDTALGLNYLHAQRPPMMHRDLKSPNVLLSEEGVAKIADVGMVRSQVKDLVTAQPVMTPLWAAPEVVRHERASIKADIWSYGILIWELATGEDITEYQPLSISRQMAAGSSSGYGHSSGGGKTLMLPTRCPPVARRIFAACTQMDPEKRPTAQQLVEWLRLDMSSPQSHK